MAKGKTELRCLFSRATSFPRNLPECFSAFETSTVIFEKRRLALEREIRDWDKQISQSRISLQIFLQIFGAFDWKISKTRKEKEEDLSSERESHERWYSYRVSVMSLYNFENLSQRQMKRQTSGNYYRMRRIYLSFFSAVFLRCSWSSTPPFIQHCPYLHKFLVPCTNRWSWRWISSILGSEVSPSLQIRFRFNKPRYTLCLLPRSSHFVRCSFNSILFINRVPEMQRDENLDNHRVYETNLTKISRRLPL